MELLSGLAPLCMELLIVRNVPDSIRLSRLGAALRLLRIWRLDLGGLRAVSDNDWNPKCWVDWWLNFFLGSLYSRGLRCCLPGS